MSALRSELAARILRSSAKLSSSQYASLLRLTDRDQIRQVEERAAPLLRDDAGDEPKRVARQLVSSYSAAGRPAEALRFARAHAPVVPTEAFEPLLSSCVKHADDSALREAVGLATTQSGTPPSAGMYSAVVGARLERGETARALRVCQEALGAGAPPSARVVGPSSPLSPTLAR